jgi:hypothetical protein
MSNTRFGIPKINLLDENVFNKQRRDISTNFFNQKATIRQRLFSILTPLRQRRKSLLSYVKRVRATCALFLIPTDMTRSKDVHASGVSTGQNILNFNRN